MGEAGDWLQEHLWAAWMGAAMLLAALEMLTLDLVLLMLAGGALAGGFVAILAPGAWAIQVLVAVATAVALLLLLRPTLLARVRNASGYQGSVQNLVGREAVVSEAIGNGLGAVRVDGSEWTAELIVPGDEIPIGAKVEIQEVSGTTLKVYPLGQPGGSSFPSITP